MTPKGWPEDRFVPGTRAISIGAGIVYRPVRSWHSGVFAGEKLEIESGDRSGCVEKLPSGRLRCPPPYTYTHRIYWDTDNPERTISAFLSYPNGMGSCDRYFWEALLSDDVYRYFDEEELEEAIRKDLRTTHLLPPEDR